MYLIIVIGIEIVSGQYLFQGTSNPSAVLWNTCRCILFYFTFFHFYTTDNKFLLWNIHSSIHSVVHWFFFFFPFKIDWDFFFNLFFMIHCAVQLTGFISFVLLTFKLKSDFKIIINYWPPPLLEAWLAYSDVTTAGDFHFWLLLFWQAGCFASDIPILLFCLFKFLIYIPHWTVTLHYFCFVPALHSWLLCFAQIRHSREEVQK